MALSPEVWDGVLRHLRAQLPPHTWNVWLAPLRLETASERVVVVCPSSFHRDRVRDHYLARIRELVARELGQPVRVELGVSAEATSTGESAAAQEPSTPQGHTGQASAAPGRILIPETASAHIPAAPVPASRQVQQELPYSFDSFVVGSCNALAREASLALARRRQPTLDQLHLISPPGMGKTHLSRAVVAEARALGIERVVYASAETFTSEFTRSARSGEMARFKQRFRGAITLLVIEDVEILEGKVKTQLEFLQTMLHVLEAGGRILLTGERHPKQLGDLDARLRSQLARGFVAEIEPPDSQTRRHILRAKAARGGFRLPDDCLDLLAEAVTGSVRELEGALIQLVTTAALLRKPIDESLTREALARQQSPLAAPVPRLDPATIVQVVASSFNTTAEALTARTRRRDILVPRQLAMYLCRRYTDASLAEIGRALDRDHPSVRNAISRVERDILERAKVRYQVEALCARIEELLKARRPTSVRRSAATKRRRSG